MKKFGSVMLGLSVLCASGLGQDQEQVAKARAKAESVRPQLRQAILQQLPRGRKRVSNALIRAAAGQETDITTPEFLDGFRPSYAQVGRLNGGWYSVALFQIGVAPTATPEQQEEGRETLDHMVAQARLNAEAHFSSAHIAITLDGDAQSKKLQVAELIRVYIEEAEDIKNDIGDEKVERRAIPSSYLNYQDRLPRFLNILPFTPTVGVTLNDFKFSDEGINKDVRGVYVGGTWNLTKQFGFTFGWTFAEVEGKIKGPFSIGLSFDTDLAGKLFGSTDTEKEDDPAEDPPSP